MDATVSEIEDAPGDAGYWHEQIRIASKEEEDWRGRAQKILDRYRDDKREGGSKLNIFAANVEILKSHVYSETPAADVRRRNVLEDELLQVAGRQVASVLEKALAYSIDDTPFDMAMEAVRDDLLIVGRGVSMEVYEAEFVKRTDIVVEQPPAPEPPAMVLPDAYGELVQVDLAPPEPPPPPVYLLDGVPIEPEFDEKTGEPWLEQKASEKVETRYVFWSDFRMEPARNWGDVGWVAFRFPMTREQLKKEFGALGKEIPLTIGARTGAQGDRPALAAIKSPDDPPSGDAKAEVWAIWDKRGGRKRRWIATGYDKVIRVDDDPLNLRDFYPCPEPIYALKTTDQMVPLPEFTLYQDQADELDDIQSRINHLIEVLRAVVLVDGDMSEVIKIASARDGDAIPIERPGVGAEDMGNSIWWWPIQTIVQVISTLSQRAEQLKQQIFELTGISDLQRGVAEPRVTAAAERTKGQYGRVRMTPRSLPMARYVRDCMRIKAEIMAELFDPATLERISGEPVTPEMVDLMREEKLRNTTISVATDATVRADEHQEKSDAIEFMGAVSGYLQQTAPLLAQMPMLAPLLLEMLKQTASTFKFGKNFEDIIDKLAADTAQAVELQQQQQMMMAQQQQMAAMAGGMPPGNGAMPPQQMGMQ